MRLLTLPALGLAALSLLAACDSSPPSGADVPDVYAVQLPITPAPGGGPQRVTLPTAALVAIRGRSWDDVRVFDKNGRRMAMALEGTITGPGSEIYHREIAAVPFRKVQAEAAAKPVTINISQAGQAVEVDAGGSVAGAKRDEVLLDTRKIDRPVDAIFVRAILPKFVAVEIAIEASSDLREWTPLGEKVLYRTADNPDVPDVLENSRFAMHGANLTNRYVKLGWDSHPDIAVTGATVAMPAVRQHDRLRLPTSGALLVDPHAVEFSIDFSTRLAAIEVTATESDGPVPVTAFGRDTPEQPWAVLAKGVVRQDKRPLKLELSGSEYDHYRLEADARTAGFSSAPKLDLMVEPMTVLAVFSGQPPYRLAVGNTAAISNFLAVQDVAENADKSLSLPVAQVGAGEPIGPVDVDPGRSDGSDFYRKLAMWLVLLAGVAILGFAVIRLMRGQREVPSE